MSLTPFVYVDVALTTVQPNDTVPLSDAAWKHVTTVLRCKAGMPVIVSDGLGSSAEATIATAQTVTINAPVIVADPLRPAVTLVQSIPKLRKLDTVVRLASEVGVDTLLPVATARSNASVAEVTKPKLSGRLEAIAHAAGEQARRSRRLQISQPVTFDTLFDRLAGTPMVLIDPAGGGFQAGLLALRATLGTAGRLAVMIGPEGGFSAAERVAAEANGAAVLRLGPAVMRTEHAGVAAVSAAMALCGHFDT